MPPKIKLGPSKGIMEQLSELVSNAIHVHILNEDENIPDGWHTFAVNNDHWLTVWTLSDIETLIQSTFGKDGLEKFQQADDQTKSEIGLYHVVLNEGGISCLSSYDVIPDMVSSFLPVQPSEQHILVSDDDGVILVHGSEGDPDIKAKVSQLLGIESTEHSTGMWLTIDDTKWLVKVE